MQPAARNCFPLEGHTAPVRSVAFFPDGQRIVTGSWDKTARVWDATTGRSCSPWKGIEARFFLWPFQRTASELSPAARIRRPRSGMPRPATICWNFTGHTKVSGRWRFRRTASALSAAVGIKTARVWDANSGKELIAHLLDTRDAVFSVAFSPDGQSIVTGSKDARCSCGMPGAAPIDRPSTATTTGIFGQLFAGRPEDYLGER